MRTVNERFRNKVDIKEPDECWEWVGATSITDIATGRSWSWV